MADTEEPERRDEEARARTAEPANDPRRPYEAPRIMKKRAINRATLFTVMTVSSMGLTSSG